MKTKCPNCNSCLTIVYRGNRRFFFCDFCNIIYDIAGMELRVVSSIEMKEDRNGNLVVDKVKYNEGFL